MDVKFTSATLNKEAQTLSMVATVDGHRVYGADFLWNAVQYSFHVDPSTIHEIVTPPTPVCGPGQVMTVGDLEWAAFKAVQLWPSVNIAVTGYGDVGRAVKFTVPEAEFPRGIVMGFTNESAYGANDYVISECPHDFDRPVTEHAQAIGAVVGGPIARLRFGTDYVPPNNTPQERYMNQFDVTLVRGRSYFINFRACAHPDTGVRGNCSSQFHFDERVD